MRLLQQLKYWLRKKQPEKIELDSKMGPKVVIDDKHKFILETSQLAMHALIASSKPNSREPKGIARQARQYAVDLWRTMRLEVL